MGERKREREREREKEGGREREVVTVVCKRDELVQHLDSQERA